MEKKRRGFAAMEPEAQKEIARLGGRTISENKDYMAEIGQRGGLKSAQLRRDAKKKEQNTQTPKSD